MIPINNSDTAWLIVADWNQENGKYHEELREDVLDPDVNDFSYQSRVDGSVGGKLDEVGGKGGAWADWVSDICPARVGSDLGDIREEVEELVVEIACVSDIVGGGSRHQIQAVPRIT